MEKISPEEKIPPPPPPPPAKETIPTVVEAEEKGSAELPKESVGKPEEGKAEESSEPHKVPPSESTE